MTNKVSSRNGSGWRTTQRCIFCLCPFLIFINILLNVFLFSSSVCYQISLFISINLFLVSFKNVIFLEPSKQSPAVALIVTLLIKYFIPESSWFLFPILSMFNYGFLIFFKTVDSEVKSSFTPCEMIIVSQGISIPFVQSSLCELSSVIPGLSLSCSDDPIIRILQILFVGLALTVIAMFYSSHHDSLSFVYLFFFTGIFLMYSRIAVVLDKEPLTWLFMEVLFTSSRIHLFELWACLFLLAVFFCVIISAFADGSSNTVIRKFFHLIIIPVYATGLKNDSTMLHFLSCCLLWIFIFLETFRITDPDNIGKTIEFFMERFKNENDKGFITLTHIYLLVGLSLSLWLSPNIEKLTFNLTSGLITVAIGDTAAGIIGSLFGSHKWPNSKKSYEGTIGAIFAQILGSMFFQYFLQVETHFLIVMILSIILSLLEAKTIQIDNLILPLYFNLLWLVFQTIATIIL